jgi:hypothetical protein
VRDARLHAATPRFTAALAAVKRAVGAAEGGARRGGGGGDGGGDLVDQLAADHPGVGASTPAARVARKQAALNFKAMLAKAVPAV